MLRSLTSAALALSLFASCGGGQSGGLAAPSDLMAKELQGGAHLTWKDNSTNETRFMIERKSGTGGFQTLTTVPFNTTQYHDAPLMPGMSYTYRVMAMGPAETTSSFTGEVVFKLP